VRRWLFSLANSGTRGPGYSAAQNAEWLASAHAPASPRGFAGRSFREPAKPTGEHCMNSGG